MFLLFCFILMAANLNGMHVSDHEKLLQIYQEEKDEREARKQSGQELQPNHEWRTYTKEQQEDFDKRLAELMARLALSTDDLRAKSKREEAVPAIKEDDAKVQELLSKSIKGSGQELSKNHDLFSQEWATYTKEQQEDYMKRLADLEVRLAELIREQQAAAAMKEKLKREEAELRARREEDEGKAKELFSKSLGDAK